MINHNLKEIVNFSKLNNDFSDFNIAISESKQILCITALCLLFDNCGDSNIIIFAFSIT
jgi:hypothetical protein